MDPATSDARRSDRALELINNARAQYQFLKTQLKQDQMLQVFCGVHNEVLGPYHISALSGDLVKIQCYEGGQKIVIAAVEQVAISMRIVPLLAYTKPTEVTFQGNQPQPPPIPTQS